MEEEYDDPQVEVEIVDEPTNTIHQSVSQEMTYDWYLIAIFIAILIVVLTFIIVKYLDRKRPRSYPVWYSSSSEESDDVAIRNKRLKIFDVKNQDQDLPSGMSTSVDDEHSGYINSTESLYLLPVNPDELFVKNTTTTNNNNTTNKNNNNSNNNNNNNAKNDSDNKMVKSKSKKINSKPKVNNETDISSKRITTSNLPSPSASLPTCSHAPPKQTQNPTQSITQAHNLSTVQFNLANKPRRTQINLCSKYNKLVMEPIRSLDELHMWMPWTDPWNIATVPLKLSNRVKQANSPKTLFCHDMMGGYIYDKYSQGHWSNDNYYFFHWAYIDIFIYFTHSFISIPPPVWTNTSHRHSVLSLATLITEHNEGSYICMELFKNDEAMRRVVDRMLEVMKYYRFDGWLINIENPINPVLIQRVIAFLRELTYGVKQINPDGQVIWYDAVTTEGLLRWQNALTPLNKPFFDVCDAIFLNYHWNDSALTYTREQAGHRVHDVYVGVDVFGRNCPGGGGWNTNYAMNIIRKYNLSAAIFAPGWVYENLEKNNFSINQEKFWSKLNSHLRSHCYSSFPFTTSFCRGIGKEGYLHGNRVLATPWTNHSAQHLQPQFLTEFYQVGEDKINTIVIDKFEVTDECGSFNGGSSLLCRGKLFRNAIGSTSRLLVRLFVVDITIYSPLLIIYTFKDQVGIEDNVRHFLELNMTTNNKPKYILMDPKASLEAPEEIDQLDQKLIQRYNLRRSPLLSPEMLNVSLNKAYSYIPLAPMYPEYQDKLDSLLFEGKDKYWNTSYFLLASKETHEGNIREIRMCLAPPTNPPDFGVDWNFSFNLGEIRIINPSSLSLYEKTVSNIASSNVTWRKIGNNSINVSFLLTWNNPTPSDEDPIDHCNVFVTQKTPISRHSADFMGQTFTETFYISDYILQKTSGRYMLQAVIQCVTASGLCLHLIKCGKIDLSWT